MNKKIHFTNIQKLDSVLKYLNHNNSPLDAIPDIVENIEFESTPKDIYLILDKLKEDKMTNSNFMDYPENFKDSAEPRDEYFITFEGRIFIENGGYRYKRQKELISITLKLLNIVVLTIGAVVAAIAALASASPSFHHFLHVLKDCFFH